MSDDQDEAIQVSVRAISSTAAGHRAGVPHLRQRSDPAAQRRRALSLRRAGYSYRRIAAQLAVPYPTVCHWLDAPESLANDAHAPARSTPSFHNRVAATVRPAPATGADLAALAAENRRLESRLDALATEHVTLQRDLRSLESRMFAALKQVTDSFRTTLARVFARPDSSREDP